MARTARCFTGVVTSSKSLRRRIHRIETLHHDNTFKFGNKFVRSCVLFIRIDFEKEKLGIIGGRNGKI